MLCGTRRFNPMGEISQFRPGDEVLHPKRPEWGDGIVAEATTIQHQGREAQRLVVRFAHRPRVTINTAVAPLMTKGDARTMTNENVLQSAASSDGRGGWLGALEQGADAHELWHLGDALTDPFSSLRRRLEATLETYRFSTEPRSITAWAVAQTGLEDPLSKYSRQELEQAFPRYARDRDNHLFDLVRTIRREGDAGTLDEVRRSLRLPAAQKALARAAR